MDELINLIPTVGFPIVAFFWMAIKMQKSVDRNSEAMEKVAVALATCPRKNN